MTHVHSSGRSETHLPATASRGLSYLAIRSLPPLDERADSWPRVRFPLLLHRAPYGNGALGATHRRLALS
jgi:hypothetical protein